MKFKAKQNTALGVYLSIEDSSLLKILEIEKDQIIEGNIIKEEEYFGNYRKYFGSTSYTISIPEIGLVDINSNKFEKL